MLYRNKKKLLLFCYTTTKVETYIIYIYYYTIQIYILTVMSRMDQDRPKTISLGMVGFIVDANLGLVQDSS